jgi:hypothetical protein
MAAKYIFDTNKVRSKLDAAIVENTTALATSIRQFFDANGDPANNSLTVWGHRSAILPNMGISISVADEGTLGVALDTRMIITLYRDDGVFYEAYSNDQGEASNGPSCPHIAKEFFLQLVGEMTTLYTTLAAFPTGTSLFWQTP